MTAPYLDPALPVAQRVADLLGRMTVEEKVGQMMQLDARDDLSIQVHPPVHLAAQLGGDVGRQQVAPGGEHLAELDEKRAEFFERHAQPLATGRIQIAP